MLPFNDGLGHSAPTYVIIVAAVASRGRRIVNAAQAGVHFGNCLAASRLKVCDGVLCTRAKVKIASAKSRRFVVVSKLSGILRLPEFASRDRERRTSMRRIRGLNSALPQ